MPVVIAIRGSHKSVKSVRHGKWTYSAEGDKHTYTPTHPHTCSRRHRQSQGQAAAVSAATGVCRLTALRSTRVPLFAVRVVVLWPKDARRWLKNKWAILSGRIRRQSFRHCSDAGRSAKIVSDNLRALCWVDWALRIWILTQVRGACWA